jgi:hypothetical protein
MPLLLLHHLLPTAFSLSIHDESRVFAFAEIPPQVVGQNPIIEILPARRQRVGCLTSSSFMPLFRRDSTTRKTTSPASLCCKPLPGENPPGTSCLSLADGLLGRHQARQKGMTLARTAPVFKPPHSGVHRPILPSREIVLLPLLTS